MNTASLMRDIAAAEAALEVAGIPATVVDDCGHEGCGWCEAATLAAAA